MRSLLASDLRLLGHECDWDGACRRSVPVANTPQFWDVCCDVLSTALAGKFQPRVVDTLSKMAVAWVQGCVPVILYLLLKIVTRHPSLVCCPRRPWRSSTRMRTLHLSQSFRETIVRVVEDMVAVVPLVAGTVTLWP